jgi:hypothetical protein
MSNNFNSLKGDRTSHISSNDLSKINNSQYNTLLTKLIEFAILIENPFYPKDSLEKRIDTIKLSLIHIGNNNLPFTIFPHLEYYFNTEKFNNSLKIAKNIKYYTIYVLILNIWKILYRKDVATCGTKQFIESVKNQNINNFEDIFKVSSVFLINYLSIRMCGRLLNNNEKNIVSELLVNERYSDFIDYLENINQNIVNKENILAKNNILSFIEQHKRKPKVLVMIAYLETQNCYFLEKMMYNCYSLPMTNPLIDIEYAFDNERIEKEQRDYTPWSRVKRIRNRMINKYPIKDYDYLYIIDSDIIDYPHNFLTRAVGLNPNGITAPLALIQNSVVFYDWCGYQKKGATTINSKYSKYIMDKGCKIRNFNLSPPYIDDDSRLVEVDCVGCTYVVPTWVFSSSYAESQEELLKIFELAKVKNHKIKENIVQYEDHPTFTDHYTICTALRSNGGKVLMDTGSAAYHADLPLFGENWH